MADQTKISENAIIDLMDQLQKAKIEFSKKALDECLHFLIIDNKIISHFEEIINAVKEDIKKNPKRFYYTQQSKKFDEFNYMTGSGFLDGLGDLIKEIILEDKKLIVDIITKVFNL